MTPAENKRIKGIKPSTNEAESLKACEKAAQMVSSYGKHFKRQKDVFGAAYLAAREVLIAALEPQVQVFWKTVINEIIRLEKHYNATKKEQKDKKEKPKKIRKALVAKITKVLQEKSNGEFEVYIEDGFLELNGNGGCYADFYIKVFTKETLIAEAQKHLVFKSGGDTKEEKLESIRIVGEYHRLGKLILENFK